MSLLNGETIIDKIRKNADEKNRYTDGEKQKIGILANFHEKSV